MIPVASATTTGEARDSFGMIVGRIPAAFDLVGVTLIVVPDDVTA